MLFWFRSKIIALIFMCIPQVVLASNVELSQKLIGQAQRIIADSIPEEKNYAENILIDAIRYDPTSIDAFAALTKLVLWQVSTRLKTPEYLYSALEFAEHVKNLDESRPLGSFLVCEVMYALNRGKEAQELCKKTEELFPEHSDTLVFQAKFYAELKPNFAIQAAQKAIGKGVSIDFVSSSIAHALTQISGPKQLGSSLARFAGIYRDRWLWHKAGLAYASQNEPEEAKAAFLTAISLGNELESRLQLAILAQGKLQNFPLAISLYKELIDRITLAQKKEKINFEVLAAIKVRLIFAEFSANKNNEALVQAVEVIHNNVNDTQIIKALVSGLKDRQLLTKITPTLENAIRENPFFIYLYSVLGEIEKDKKDFDKSISYYSKAIILSPDYDDLYSSRAHVYYETKKYQKALLDFENAIKIKPQEANYHYNKACMLALINNFPESFASLKTAIMLDSRLIESAKKDTDLLGLRELVGFEPQLVEIGVISSSDADEKIKLRNARR